MVESLGGAIVIDCRGILERHRASGIEREHAEAVEIGRERLSVDDLLHSVAVALVGKQRRLRELLRRDTSDGEHHVVGRTAAQQR
jgi:hypothetical protein